MGLLDLFSPKKIGEVATSAVKGLDSIVYTEQEKAEKTQVAQELYSKLWMAATPSALSRRIIAAVVVFVWAFLVILIALLYGLSREWALFVFDLLKDVVLQPVNIILGFYFLKQIVSEYRDK
jgi:cation transport ATPase